MYVWVLIPAALHSFTNSCHDYTEEDFDLMDRLICGSAAVRSRSYVVREVGDVLVGGFRNVVYGIDSL